MAKLKGLLIILAILSSTSARHSRSRVRKTPDDLTQLFLNSDGSDSSESKNHNSENKETMVCETDHCRQLADVFSETIDKSIDPCVDFYKFTCGGWEAKKPIPKYESTWSRRKLFTATLQNHLRDELEKEPTSEDILPIRQAKKWYRSCMDTKTRNTRGINPIVSILMQTGGWPMIMDAEEWYEDQSWKQIEENYMRLTGEYIFYKMRLWALSPGNSANMSGEIWISPPELPLDDVLPLRYRNYTGDDLASYAKLIEGAAKLFIEKNKADVPDEQLMKDIEDLIEFEKSLYMAVHGPKNTTGINKNKMREPNNMNLDQFISWWDNLTEFGDNNSNLESVSNGEKIDWKKILESMFDFARVELYENVRISISDAVFFLHFPKILQSAKKRTIVNYIHWKFVSHALRYTIDEVKDILFDLIEHEYGVQERSPRWLECVEEMEMEDAVSLSFVENYFEETTAKAANEMSQNIKKELGWQIENSNWLSAEAKEMAKKKLNAMRTLLGYPDWFKNRTAVVNHYKGLTIGYDYLDNVLSFMRYEKILKIRDAAGYTKKENSGWGIDPITVNAAYYPLRNTLNVPAVAFQVPLFGIQVPNYVNYGITGSIVGHEISHGFDVDGIKFGINGTSDNLWEEDMMKMYHQQSKCFVKQFDNYFGGRIIPLKYAIWYPPEDWSSGNFTITMGRVTVGENIADTTGVQSVFNAYMRMKMNAAPNGEMKLPGFEDFSDEQMFFLSYAGVWCTVTTPEYEERKKPEYEVHSPPHMRVFGAVSNTLGFAKAFKCPKGSPMNPEDKCDIWTKPGATLKLKPAVDKRHHYRHRFDVDW